MPLAAALATAFASAPTSAPQFWQKRPSLRRACPHLEQYLAELTALVALQPEYLAHGIRP